MRQKQNISKNNVAGVIFIYKNLAQRLPGKPPEATNPGR